MVERIPVKDHVPGSNPGRAARCSVAQSAERVAHDHRPLQVQVLPEQLSTGMEGGSLCSLSLKGSVLMSSSEKRVITDGQVYGWNFIKEPFYPELQDGVLLKSEEIEESQSDG